jgi:hypothetical protein
VIFDKHASSKAFAGVFGGCFAVVGGTILLFVIASAFRSMRPSARKPSSTRRSGSTVISSQTTSAFGSPRSAGAGSFGSSAFGNSGKDADPILGAYTAGHGGGLATDTGLSTSGLSDAGLGSVPAGSGLSTSPASPAADVGSDLDSLAKLADLHKSGAITDAEFAREKAKLLGS